MALVPSREWAKGAGTPDGTARLQSREQDPWSPLWMAQDWRQALHTSTLRAPDCLSPPTPPCSPLLLTCPTLCSQRRTVLPFQNAHQSQSAPHSAAAAWPVHWLPPGLQSSLGYPCDPPPSQVFKEAHPVTQFKMTAQFHNPAFRHPDLVCFLSHWASSHKPRYLRIRNVSPPH